MADLLADYLAGKPELMQFFGRRLSELRAAPRPWDEGLLEDVNAYQQTLGGSGEAKGDEAVVVTGQQPGLLGGPLYTIYKIITAIQLAQKLSEKSGRRVLPVYWIAGDDHDFEEVRETHVLTRRHASLSLRYEPEHYAAGSPVREIPVDDSVHALIDAARNAAPGSENAGEIAAFLHDSASQSSDFAAWHGRIIAKLFHNTPLVLFAPHLQAARRAAAPIIAREADAPGESTGLLNEQGQALEALGYAAQVLKQNGAVNFFLERDGGRGRVFWRDGAFRLPDARAEMSASQVQALLAAQPEAFSPNVALRCVVQQQLFPTAVYVAGPGELAYWAQLKPFFRHFDQEMPAVVPRLRAVLLDTKLEKLLAELDLCVHDLAAPEQELVLHALRRLVQHPARPAVARHRERMRSAAAALSTELTALGLRDQRPEDLSERIERVLARRLDHLERVLLHADVEQERAAIARVQRLQTALWPERRPQERHYSIVSYLFEHGWQLIPRLQAALDAEAREVQQVTL